jgi:hypothetical protein
MNALWKNLFSTAGLIITMNAFAKEPLNGGYYIGFVNKTGTNLEHVCAYYGDKRVA